MAFGTHLWFPKNSVKIRQAGASEKIVSKVHGEVHCHGKDQGQGQGHGHSLWH